MKRLFLLFSFSIFLFSSCQEICESNQDCSTEQFCNTEKVCASECSKEQPCSEGYYCSARSQCLKKHEQTTTPETSCKDGQTRECKQHQSSVPCGKSIQFCLQGKWQPCAAIPTATQDDCNGHDDNCNGLIDEDCKCKQDSNCKKGQCREGLCQQQTTSTKETPVMWTMSVAKLPTGSFFLNILTNDKGEPTHIDCYLGTFSLRSTVKSEVVVELKTWKSKIKSLIQQQQFSFELKQGTITTKVSGVFHSKSSLEGTISIQEDAPEVKSQITSHFKATKQPSFDDSKPHRTYCETCLGRTSCPQ